MKLPNPAVTLSIRITPKIKIQLEKLSDATGRTKSYLAAQAIENYLVTQAWQVTMIKKAVEKANKKDTKFIDHEQVSQWVDSWDTEDEQDMPK